VALGGSNLALLVPDRCLDAWLDRLASAISALCEPFREGDDKRHGAAAGATADDTDADTEDDELIDDGVRRK